jgi:hypothetical protein
MVPVLLKEIGEWLDQFNDSLDQWEAILADLHGAFLKGDRESIVALCESGTSVQTKIAECKEKRLELIHQAMSMGYLVRTIKELSLQLDGQWPALWTHRISNLELQLNRVQQLSTSLWVNAFQSKTFVSEMLMVLSTGRSEVATYSPNENASHEGGYLVDEAA